MEKTITMQQVIDFREAAEKFKEKSLPLQGAYKLMKISNALNKETDFYGEKFQEILNTYGAKDEEGNFKFSEDGTQIIIKDGQEDECNKALENLLEMEVTVDNLNFEIDNLGEIECAPEELEGLLPLLN